MTLRTRLAVLCLGLLAWQGMQAQFSVPRPMRTIPSELMRSAPHRNQQDTLRVSMPLAKEVGTTDQHSALEFAHNIELDVSPATHGVWRMAGNNVQTWSLTLHSPQALSMGIRLEGYHLPEEGALYIYGADGRVRGAFTDAHNSPSGVLQLAPVAGGNLTLVYEAPEGMTPQSPIPFRLTTLSLGYRPLPHLRALDRDKYGFDEGEPFFDLQHSNIPRYACAPGIVGFPEYAPQMRSVVMMITDGSTLSTATLINNARQDGTAYILTSAHCISNRVFSYPTDMERIRRTVRSAVFFFGFQSPSADNEIRPTEEMTLSGAELVLYEPESDAALLRITGLPTDTEGKAYIPSSYNAYYAGWNISTTPTGSYYGIHHPLGMTKRLSVVDGDIYIDDYSILFDYPWEDKHWYIRRWSVGTTASGSSGSPLFDASGHVIGALSGGRSSCNNPVSDNYWALQRIWKGNGANALKRWLDPDDQGIESLPGLDPHATDPVLRLSGLYASAQQNLKIQKLKDGTLGLGHPITLTAETKPLGAFIVFRGNASLQRDFPAITAELSPITTGSTVSTPVWSASTSSALYHRYNATSLEFDTNVRTLAYDTIELFIPATEIVSIPAGEYLLSLRSTDDTELRIPLLYRNLRTTQAPDRLPSWIRTLSGWNTVSEPRQYWIDLLIEGNQPEKPYSTAGTTYTAYYSREQLYIYNPSSDEARLVIYNTEGKLVLQQILPHGESILPINLPPQATYIAVIRGAAGRVSLKF